jgi:hypothetical protein
MKKNYNNIINPYLDKYPEMSIKGLSNLIYKEHPLHFNNPEAVRGLIRLRKGSSGTKSRLNSKERYFTQEAIEKKYNLPKSIKTEYVPYRITTNKALIFADAHVPFHDIQAFETMFDFTVNKDIDTVILDGDIMDCHKASPKFIIDPTVDDLVMEREKTMQLLDCLKQVYPKAKIIYKFGNHEKRFEDYLKYKAPEIYKFKEFRLNIILDLFNKGIEYVEHERYIILNNGLSILHAHEYANGVSSPANPARTTFLRTKSTALSAHNHQTSEHTENRIDGELLSCWSIGCMCDLHPAYMPLNKWNNGFAIYTRDDDKFWHVQNKKIIKGRVV